jgi:hypothetical protein
MKAYVRTGLKVTVLVAAMIAARPYAEFLAAPPAEEAGRWAVTIIALSVVAAISVILFGTRSKPQD